VLVAEPDPFRDPHEVQPTTQLVSELDDTSTPPNAITRAKSGPEQSNGNAASLQSWLLLPSFTPSKPAADHPQEMDAAQQKLPPVQAKVRETEADVHNSRDSYGSFALSKTQQNASISVQSSTNAEKQLSCVAQRIWEAADGNVWKTNLDAAFRKKGVDGALELLIGSYESALAAVRGIEQQIYTATKGNMREKDVNAAFRTRGAEGALELLIKQYKQAIAAERELNCVEEKIREAAHDIPQRELDRAFKQEGVEGPLRLLIEDYRAKMSSGLILKRVGEQIRGVLRNVPRKDLDAAFNAGGVEGAFNFLVQFYQPFVDAQQELVRVEKELKKAAPGLLAANDLDVAIGKTGVDGAVKLLVNHLQGTINSLKYQVQGLQKDLSIAGSQYSTLEHEKKKLDSANYELRRRQEHDQAAISDLKAKQTERIEALDAKWKVDLKNQQEEAANQTRNLEQRHTAELERREANHRLERGRWEQALVSAKEKHKEEATELQRAMKSLEIEFNSKMDRKREEFEAREEEARRGEMARMEQFRRDNEALKGELVAREHFKGLSDPEIYSSFKKLAGEVDSFSRIQWEKRKESRWPLPESTLKRSENPRKLKQHIVQGSIWVILNEKIFRSPFEVFGEEGQKMHRDWTETFGEGE
jgi:hypothetical protein